MDFRLGFGPMSLEIVDAIFDYAQARQRPIMIIASRNQIDSQEAGGGYVASTEAFCEHIQGRDRTWVKICRDHCGPYFNDAERALDFRTVMTKTKATMAADIEQGFDLIHIDTSRCDQDYELAARQLFEFAQGLSDTVEFEFGTEENVGVSASVYRYDRDCALACDLSDRVRFVVGQTGSLVWGDQQAGRFDQHVASMLANTATAYGVRLKEHNADYLSAADVAQRRYSGVHALNIAPEFGVLQTRVLAEQAQARCPELWQDFGQHVLKSHRWPKWTDAKASDDFKILVTGHYAFASDQYRRLLDNIDHDLYISQLRARLYDRFDTYFDNL